MYAKLLFWTNFAKLWSTTVCVLVLRYEAPPVDWGCTRTAVQLLSSSDASI